MNASTTGVNYGVSGSTASPIGVGVLGENLNTSGVGYGVVGNSSSSDGVGINGNASSTTGANFGVFGQSFSTSGTGVSGAALATTGFAVGVAGDSDSTSGVGVVGTASAATGSAFGVKGVSGSSTGVGVLGIADTTAGANLGVEGMNSSPAGAGVQGTNNSTTGSAFGVAALTVSTGGIGMYAVAVEPSITTGGARPVAVWGSTNQSGGVAVAGTADDGYAMAAANYSVNAATVRFENQDPDSSALVVRTLGAGGSCFIDGSGNLLCEGTKSAVVPVDGGTRKVALYAVEAPENWFEDAGSGRLANGSAVVHLESIFAQTVNSGVEYHVFLTPKGDCKGLYVTNETGDSFEVRELGGGAANIAFDYRIMARRKGYETVRLGDKTERFAKSAAMDKQMQRTQPKLPGKLGPDGGAVLPQRIPATARIRSSSFSRVPGNEDDRRSATQLRFVDQQETHDDSCCRVCFGVGPARRGGLDLERHAFITLESSVEILDRRGIHEASTRLYWNRIHVTGAVDDGSDNSSVEYHVFLTPNGDCKGLYVTSKSADSFAMGTTTAAPPRPIARVRTPLPHVMQVPVVVKKDK